MNPRNGIPINVPLLGQQQQQQFDTTPVVLPGPNVTPVILQATGPDGVVRNLVCGGLTKLEHVAALVGAANMDMNELHCVDWAEALLAECHRRQSQPPAESQESS